MQLVSLNTMPTKLHQKKYTLTGMHETLFFILEDASNGASQLTATVTAAGSAPPSVPPSPSFLSGPSPPGPLGRSGRSGGSPSSASFLPAWMRSLFSAHQFFRLWPYFRIYKKKKKGDNKCLLTSAVIVRQDTFVDLVTLGSRPFHIRTIRLQAHLLPSPAPDIVQVHVRVAVANLSAQHTDILTRKNILNAAKTLGTTRTGTRPPSNRRYARRSGVGAGSGFRPPAPDQNPLLDNAGVVLHSEAPSGHPRQPLAVESGEVGAEKALADAVPGQAWAGACCAAATDAPTAAAIWSVFTWVPCEFPMITQEAKTREQQNISSPKQLRTPYNMTLQAEANSKLLS